MENEANIHVSRRCDKRYFKKPQAFAGYITALVDPVISTFVSHFESKGVDLSKDLHLVQEGMVNNLCYWKSKYEKNVSYAEAPTQDTPSMGTTVHVGKIDNVGRASETTLGIYIHI
jgi:hypothetical protein